jgi:uncharacterized Zn-binding protein involved in type VI secretion
MPEAARKGDWHDCPKTVPRKHVGGPVEAPCEPTVLICAQPAARVTDELKCIGAGATDTIVEGSATVLIGNQMAARVGDATAHGGVLKTGCETVIICDGSTPVTMLEAKTQAALFVKPC